EGSPARLVDLDLAVQAEAGMPLEVVAITANGHRASVRTESPLAPARSQPAGLNLLRDQLGRLGGTIYRLRDLAATILGAPMIPKSLLNQVRRDLVAQLDLAAAAPPPRAIAPDAALPALLTPIHQERRRPRQQAERSAASDLVSLSVLCRWTDQIEAAVALGMSTIYADYQDIKEYAAAVAAARRGGAAIYLATPRIEKPFESILFVADFSLNAANPLTVELFKSRGAMRVTASYDLNSAQLFDLIAAVPPDWLEV